MTLPSAPSTPTSPTSTVAAPPPSKHAHACTVCARRKVRCDKADPCFHCKKARIACVYEAPSAQSRPRPRKRAADAELLARLERYEALMQQHGVAYESATHRWVASGWENNGGQTESQVPVSAPLSAPLSAASGPPSTQPFSFDPPPLVPPTASDYDQYNSSPATSSSTMVDEPCMWQDLPVELRYPPVQALRASDDPLLHPTPSLQSILTEAAVGNAPPLSQLHPPPRQIFALWQRFLDGVNPLTKLVHVPTLQPRVLDASADVESVPPPLNALLFSVYLLAITAMSQAECETLFGEPKVDLLLRYRVATLRALVAADFMVARDLEVLQALMLFLMADPESDLTGSLVGMAMRLGQRLGLHLAGNPASKLSVFDREMRIRLWWALCGLWARAGLTHPTALKTSLLELGDVRLPLNVNDADLHPDMTEEPVSSLKPTEMLCVLVKYEFTNWVRHSPATTQTFENIVRSGGMASTSSQCAMRTIKMSTAEGRPPKKEEDAVQRIGKVYEEKFVRRLDTRIPLHGLAHAMIRLALARMRFKLYHPRNFATSAGAAQLASSGWQVPTPGRRLSASLLFDTALCLLETLDYSVQSAFASHIYMYMTLQFQLDAYICVLSELRRRTSGERVTLAWRLVEGLYTEHPEIISPTETNNVHKGFFLALGDLTLEAWAAREAALRAEEGDNVVIPIFIQQLRESKAQAQDGTTASPYANVPVDEVDIGWACWEDFLRL
ncbi:hypothetical protein SBRCBS47491_000898 [Sporothrix bragantina]|uniref:Zn(2)-C6 fungal-type domain-containing protein n=1 Tax=Sporothrix bragantina TaxID=671064 RepID=A0ABP0AU59_9PEZI